MIDLVYYVVLAFQIVPTYLRILLSIILNLKLFIKHIFNPNSHYTVRIEKEQNYTLVVNFT